MVVEKDIVAISIPFSAGVVTAALLPPGSDALWAVAGGASLAAAGLLCLLSGRGNRTAGILVLYYLLGLFCAAGSALGLPPPARPSRLAERGQVRLLERVFLPG